MIFDLIILDKKEELEKLLQNEIVDLNQKDKSGNTPLHKACQIQNLGIVKILLKYPHDINSKGLDDLTPLHYAVQKRNVDIVNLLIDNKADVNIPNVGGNTPLWTAVMMYAGNDNIIRTLLAHGANPSIPNKHGVTLFELLDMPKNKDISHLFE